jgi:Ala-tRNA(Pro) deacylase
MPTEANITAEEARLYAALTDLGIAWVRHEHPPVFTVEEAERHWTEVRGLHCKNLFLRNKKGNRHYLVVMEHRKNADLRRLAEQVGDDRLSFASPERLQAHLGLSPGAVSPFGLINDRARAVQVIVDADLRQAARVAFHPNVNTATVVIGGDAFARFLASTGHAVRYVTFAPTAAPP